MIPPRFDYVAPKALAEALQMLAANPEESKVMAGGHSLLPLMKLRLASPTLLIDLQKIDDLRYTEVRDGWLRIGALTRYVDLIKSPVVREAAPILSQAAALVGDAQVRNRGTIAGSIAHADPAADMPAVICSLNAVVDIQSVSGARQVAADDFFTDIFETTLGEGEIVMGVNFPIWETPRQHYEKFRRRMCDWAIVGGATSSSLDQSGHIARVGVVLTNVGPTPSRARGVEDALLGEKPTRGLLKVASERAAEGLNPTPELNAPAHYKQHLAKVMTLRALMVAFSVS